ncbi:MAG: VWA domain-containing protein, partial [Elusimicrobia bacterium]|nr:VWA domain-containing protein [Elusimicrobiota bacterium]
APLAPAAAAVVPAAASVAAAKAAVAAPTAFGSIRRQASERETAPAESVQAAARLFDGAVRRAPAFDDVSAPVSAPAAGPRRGFLRRVFAAAAVATLSLGLTLPSLAQTAAPGAAPQSVTQAAAPAPADTQEVALPRPVVASITADRSDATVGERIHLTITLRNPTDKPITITSLRAGLQDALPEDLEIQGKGPEAPVVLAPGETKTVVYETIPFASGDIAIKDVVASVAVAETSAYPDGIEIVVPDTKVTVKSVLTPDWKQKGLRDIVDVMRERTPSWVWIAGGALGFILLIGLERILAARRWYPKLDARRLSLVTDLEAEISRLERAAGTMAGPEFNAAVQEAVTRFMVDFAGLPRRERGAAVLARDLKASKAFRSEHVAVAVGIAERAEAARFSGAQEDEAGRLRELARLRALVEAVAGKTKAAAPETRGGLNAFAAASGLQFGSPWALLLFVPFAAYLWKAWRARGTGERFAVSSAAQASAHRSWREKLAGIPKAARLSAIALLILALARPMIGVQRLESYTPSTDTMIVEDRSGSMDEAMGNVTKLQAAGAAIRAYVDEQRKGTQNRVGMETFDDTPYVDVRLTTDYDALISHLKEIKTGGSTAIGEGILTAVGHFAEVNMMDLDAAKDARVGQMKTILRTRGLAAALEYAKAYPDLMDEVLRPDRAKVIVVFTDGESNSGIDPADAAKIAASLG